MKSAGLKQRLLEALKSAGKINPQGIERAERFSRERNIRFFDALTQLNLIGEKDLMTFLSSECGIPFLNLSKLKINRDLAQLVPERVARQYTVVPVSSIARQITVAVADPFNLFAVDDIQRLTELRVDIAISTEKDILQAIDDLYGAEFDLSDLVEKAEDAEAGGPEGGASEIVLGEAVESSAAPIVRMVDLILLESYRKGASDIHVEPLEDCVRVRYRIDGQLREALTIPKKNQNAVTARLKILSNLDITENRVPQDGRFKVRFNQREVDYRVSSLPVYWGSKIVMRALDRGTLRLGLDVLGFSEKAARDFREAIRRPFGMIIITGPTGSGKSTTLYSLLSELNTSEKNIITIEDPIEYQLTGITQMQTKPEIGFTFANGLRAILRQSPDVVMLGEIRDFETADIAIKASLTGQVVLSTLHTNDAAGAITRLEDMGIEPFLVSAGLTLIAAQRLLRKICAHCRAKQRLDPAALERFTSEERAVLKGTGGEIYAGRGCDKCGGTGYKGRIAVTETLAVDTRIRRLIEARRSSPEIKECAVAQGMITLRHDALAKVKEGVTTLEEVFRVTAEDV